MLTGVNHVAVVTADLERFLAFYSGVFDLPVVFHETDPPLRHAILRTGPASWLHPADVADLVDPALADVHEPRPLP